MPTTTQPTPAALASMQRKLDKIATLSVELEAEAKAAYGQEAFIFVEPESGIFVMAGDAEEAGGRSVGAAARQKFFRLQSNKFHRLEAGAW